MRGPVGRKLCSHPLMSPSVMDFTRGNTPGIGSALAPSPELLLRRADLRAGLRCGFARLSARIIASSSLSTSKSVPNELPRASDERLLRLLQLRPGMVKLLSPLLLLPPPPPLMQPETTVKMTMRSEVMAKAGSRPSTSPR